MFHFDTFSGRIPTGNNSKARLTDFKEGDGAAEKNLILLKEFEVEPLTDVQRLIFFWVTICIAIIALLGNLLVIYVNISR